MKIAYNSMWHGFDIENNWFNYMFMDYFNNPEIEFSYDQNDADLIFSSVFGPPPFGRGRKIFFTGESRKDGYTPDQILLGFDQSNIQSLIFRLPLWMIYINWWPEKFYPQHIVGGPTYKVDLERLSTPSNSEQIATFLSRPFFCSMVVTNPTENRQQAYQALSSIDAIHGYGRMFGNYYTGEKSDILNQYKFNVCFENTISDGYVTEKLFEAKLSGSIPIYWGDSWAKKDFNPNGFIDYTDMSSMQELVDTVRKIYSSVDLMGQYVYEPMFKEPPSLEPLFEFFDKVKLK